MYPIERTARLAAQLILSALLTFTVSAQFRASIQGVITDATGAVLPEANVELTSQETGLVRETVSSGNGYYRFSSLAPGNYSIKVTKNGFETEIRRDVRVRAEQMEGADFQLSLGEVTQQVTVSAAGEPLLTTEEAGVSRTLSREEIERLPQLNRDPYELLRLAPGIFGDGARGGSGNAVGLPNTTGPGGSNLSIFQTENQTAISANGQRLSNNVFLIDGVSVNSLNWGGAALVTPSQESVKEMRVNSNTFSAEYGRNSGAQIEVVSRNGTNEFHGSGFFKFNEPALNAYNQYGGPSAPPVRVENRFRQYGGSIGGPILRNRLFFFFAYEGLSNNSNPLTTRWVETPEYRQTVINARPGSATAQILSAPGIEPRVTTPLSAECPSGFGINCQVVNGGIDVGSPGGATGQYVNTGANPLGGGFDGIPDFQFVQYQNPADQTGHQFNPRIDYQRDTDTIAFSAFITPFTSVGSDGGSGSRPIGDIRREPMNSAYTLSWNRIASPTMINAARFNFTRFSDDQVSANADVNFGIPRIEIEALPFDRVRFGAPRGEATPGLIAQNIFEVNDTFTKVFSAHTLKLGFVWRHEQNNSAAPGGARPIYSFQGPWNLANGTRIFEGINAEPTTGLPSDGRRYFRTNYLSGFLQDDWKVTRNLTLNLGLRYEYFGPLSEQRGRLSNLFFGDHLLQDAQVRPVDRLYDRDTNNFAPRFGFAYNPDALNKRIVVRGGFGVFYNQIPTAVYGNTRGNPPFFARYGLCCGTASNPFAGGQIFYTLGDSESIFSYPVNPALVQELDPETGTPAGRAVEIYMAQQDTPNPYVYIWNFDVQYQLPFAMVGSAGYQGSAGHKQIRLVNQQFLYPRAEAFSAVYNPQPDVSSNYNAMLLSLNKRLWSNLQFAVNYRWSKSIDTLSYEGPGFVTNQTYPFDLSTERGPSDFDVRHFVTFSGFYTLPVFEAQQGVLGKLLGGWSINTIYTWRTGFPWTPVTGQSVSTPGGPSLSPTRPVAYFCCALDDTSDEAFIRPNGNFPEGPRSYFDISRSGVPGIGRNSFRGPRYDALDVSFMKRTAIPYLGETGSLELRANLYNALNQLNLAPFNFGSASTRIEDQFFGRAQNGLAGRVVEFQARVSF